MVFVAHDEELRREVALKEIQDRHADCHRTRGRFLQEARVTGGLEHPGCATAADVSPARSESVVGVSQPSNWVVASYGDASTSRCRPKACG